jgi:hypothetical protein
MKLIADTNINLAYYYNSNDFTEVWYYGDYLRKTTELLKDDIEKTKLESQIYNIQNTEWPSLEAYHNSLNNYKSSICNHIGTNENPFII